jgi:hypothetical protein
MSIPRIADSLYSVLTVVEISDILLKIDNTTNLTKFNISEENTCPSDMLYTPQTIIPEPPSECVLHLKSLFWSSMEIKLVINEKT